MHVRSPSRRSGKLGGTEGSKFLSIQTNYVTIRAKMQTPELCSSCFQNHAVLFGERCSVCLEEEQADLDEAQEFSMEQSKALQDIAVAAGIELARPAEIARIVVQKLKELNAHT